jgi:hypothetical protein
MGVESDVRSVAPILEDVFVTLTEASQQGAGAQKK